MAASLLVVSNVRMRVIVLLVLFFSSLLALADPVSVALDSARYYKFKSSAKALLFSQQAYKLAKKNNDTGQWADAAYSSGVANYLAGNYDTALSCYIEAEKLYEIKKNTNGLIDICAELCLFYLKGKKIAKAEEFINKGIAMANAVNNTSKKANAYNNKGLVFLDTKRYDSAINCFNISYGYYKVTADNTGMAYSLGYLASAYAEKGMTDKSLACLQQSIPLLVKSGDKYGEASGINNIGELLLAQHKPAEALVYFNEALVKSKALSFDDLSENIYRMQALCYQGTGDFKKAYEAKLAEVAVHEKLLSENQLKVIAELQTKYETGKKEQQNKLLTETNLRQTLQLSRSKIITFSLLAIAILVIGVLYLFYNRYKLRQESRFREEFFSHEKLRASAVVDAEENERQRLSRELHDGIGQLLAATRRKMQTLPQAEVATDAAYNDSIALLDDSIKEVRQLSHNMMPPWLRNKTLVQAFEELVDQVTRTTTLKVHTEWVDMENLHLEKTQVLMLYRSLQEMISNVLRHSGATKLNIEVVNHGDELNIMVYDNGKGFDKEAMINSGAGIGLKNIQSRIEYIGGRLQIDTYPGKGTTYVIDLPLKGQV